MYILKTIRIFSQLLLLLVTINLNAQSFYQTTSDLRLRSGPSIKYKSLGIIKKGEKVNVIKKTNSSWFKIEYNRKTGFLLSKFITPIVEAPKVEEPRYIERETVRSNPTMFYVIGAVVVMGLIFIVSSNKKKKITNSTQTFNYVDNKINIEKENKEKLIKNILKNIKIEVTTSSLNNGYKDDSIIDVTGNSQKLDINKYNDTINQTNYPQQQYSYNNYDPNDYRLGKQYKDKLNLSNQEVSWLNKFWNPSNVFLGIEGCCIETIKLYLATLKQLIEQLKKKESTIAKEVLFFQEEIKKLHQANNTSYWGEYDNTYLNERVESEVFMIIFKRAENTVRESFNHKRKISGDFPYSNQSLIQEFENRIGLETNQIIKSLSLSLTPPDEATEIELYSQNTNRWKIKFEELSINYKGNTKQFIDSIVSLGNLNKKNASVENIFFEASKFISKHNKEAALTLYIYYLYHDLKSVTFDNKQLTKTIQKNLFKTNDQLHDFEIVVSELVKDKNLEKALQEVSKIYAFKRKKIQLYTASIKEVQEQDSETVELLNVYLKDEYEGETNTIKAQEVNNDEIKIEITQKTETVQNSTYTNDIIFTQIQTATLEIFAKNNFSVSQSDLEVFAKSKGVFKNQLIESINDICYENLEDVLIEEEVDQYILNPNYYQRLLAK